MSWVAIVLWILTHAGELIGLIKQLIGLFHTLPKEDKVLAQEEIGNAIKEGNKDTVRGILEKWKGKCEVGTIGCPWDVVK